MSRSYLGELYKFWHISSICIQWPFWTDWSSHNEINRSTLTVSPASSAAHSSDRVSSMLNSRSRQLPASNRSVRRSSISDNNLSIISHHGLLMQSVGIIKRTHYTDIFIILIYYFWHFQLITRSQAVARIADRTASHHLRGSCNVIGHVTIW